MLSHFFFKPVLNAKELDSNNKDLAEELEKLRQAERSQKQHIDRCTLFCLMAVFAKSACFIMFSSNVLLSLWK